MLSPYAQQKPRSAEETTALEAFAAALERMTANEKIELALGLIEDREGPNAAASLRAIWGQINATQAMMQAALDASAADGRTLTVRRRPFDA